jgi:hypothetical protein
MICATAYFYVFCIFNDVSTLCLYKNLCVMVSLKMAKNRRNMQDSLYVKINCNILYILEVHFFGITPIKILMHRMANIKKKDRQCTYKCNIVALSRNHCCRAKVISISYSQCVSVASVTQHAKRTRHTILSTVVSPTQPLFSTLFYKRHDFMKKSFWT